VKNFAQISNYFLQLLSFRAEKLIRVQLHNVFIV